MRKTNKKGFTIVELVIVIAVIAILAAVLIPTYSSLVKKANRSADIQAVRQMNTALAVNEVTEGKSISEVHKALSESGMTSKDYHPLTSDTYFFWDAETNRVLYTDDTYTVIFPEERKGEKFGVASGKNSNGNWYTLSGEIKEETVVNTSETVEVSSAGQLYYLSNNLGSVKTIKLSGTINLMGADIGFKVEGSSGIKKELTITADSECTLKGLAQITSFYTESKAVESLNKDYGSGLVPYAKNAKITIKNITLENAEIGNLEIGSVGALLGKVESGCDITLKSCKVINSSVYGRNKVGGLIGAVSTATINIENCELKNVTVYCSEGQAGKAIGCAFGTPTITMDKNFSEWVTDCSTKLVTGSFDRPTLEGTIKAGETEVKDIACLVAEVSDKGVHEQVEGETTMKYRMYAENAYMTIQKTSAGNGATVKAGEDKISGETYSVGAKNVTINGETVYAPYLHIIK